MMAIAAASLENGGTTFADEVQEEPDPPKQPEHKAA